MSIAEPSLRSRRPGSFMGALLATATLIALGSAILSGCSSPDSSTPTTSPPTTTTVPVAKNLAVAFLNRYVASDGRVIRYDQGGDSVSEGQAYGLLLAVAAHDAARFASVWTWEKDNLQEANGLFAYHWSNGAVVGTGNATDADLDTAWALVLGATAFDQPTYRKEGLAVAAAVLANETVVSAGRIELVAGPWARNAPYAVDVSYFSPEAMATLAAASHDVRWTQLATNSQQLVQELQGGASTRYLPPDWALLSASGTIAPSNPPSGGVPPSYGLDAERVPVWYAADCTTSGRALSANEWPIIGRTRGRGRVPGLQPDRSGPTAVHQQPGAGGGGGVGRRRPPVLAGSIAAGPGPERRQRVHLLRGCLGGPRHRAADHRPAVPVSPHAGVVRAPAATVRRADRATGATGPRTSAIRQPNVPEAFTERGEILAGDSPSPMHYGLLPTRQGERLPTMRINEVRPRPSTAGRAPTAWKGAAAAIVVVLGALGVIGAAPGHAGAAPTANTWNQQFPNTSPPTLAFAAMADDPATGQVVLFGGENGTTYLNQTWTWNGATWTEQATTANPSPRVGASLAWDPTSNQLVLFGGKDGTGTYLNDTWTWSGTAWTPVTPATSPGVRAGAALGERPVHRPAAVRWPDDRDQRLRQ